MATLSEKSEYRLSAFPSSAPNQTLFLVKLTDSSERALERFMADHKKSSRRPMIDFESGAGGSIRIPSDRRTGDKNDEINDDVFYFNIGQEAAGSLDITAEMGRGQLRPIGSAKQKLTVNATSETFSQTRDKMALLEDANKKQQAKEIKPGLKGKRGKQMVTTKPTSSATSVNNSKTSFVAASVAKSLPSTSSTSRGGNSSSSMPEVGVRVKTKPEVARTKQPTPPPMPRSQESPASGSSLVTPSSATSLVPLTGQPLRDRILHLLALKAYKKAELVLRLRIDGYTTPKDEPEALSDVLNSIGSLSKSKPNSYMLKKEMFKEVDRKWEFYNEDDRKQVAKQLDFIESQNAAKAGNGEVPGKGASINAVTSIAPSPSSKRTSSSPTSPVDPASAAPVSKKPKRIAHKPKGPTGSSPSGPDASPSENRGVSPPPLTSSSVNPLSSADQNSSSSTASSNHSPSLSKSYKTSFKTAPLPVALMNAKLLGASTGRPFAESTKSQKGGNPPSTTQATTTSKEESVTGAIKENDYLVKFSKVVSDEQRDQYAREFDEEYDEYKDLMVRVRAMAEHAQKLDQKVDETADGTPEREAAKKALVNYHAEYKRTGVYDKRRANYLQKKLTHIKRLIAEYEVENKLAVNNNDGDANVVAAQVAQTVK